MKFGWENAEILPHENFISSSIIHDCEEKLERASSLQCWRPSTVNFRNEHTTEWGMSDKENVRTFCMKMVVFSCL